MGKRDKLAEVLRATNVIGGYQGSIICTDQGLLVASAGDIPEEEGLAGFSSLFDEIVRRGSRYLSLNSIDEVSVLDARAGRIVIRPVFSYSEAEGGSRIFLVMWMSASASWRRNTHQLLVRLREMLVRFSAGDSEVAFEAEI